MKTGPVCPIRLGRGRIGHTGPARSDSLQAGLQAVF